MARKFIPFSPPSIGNEEIKAVVSVLRSGWLSMGPKTIEFENAFAKYVGCRHAIAVNSCTAALFLSLKAHGIKEGDEVITTPFTFASTANTIVHCGAKPVFADIQPDTFNIDPEQIRKKITKKTKAIVPVHYGGHPCDMDEIREIAEDHGLTIIEDAAHALGAEYKGKKVGALGNTSCFSFYPTKNITTGEGGMITTNSAELANHLRSLRLHGIDRDAWKRYSKGGSWYYEVREAGYKFNMTDLNAALGLVQLKRLGSMNRQREKVFNFYTRGLEKAKGIRTPIIRNYVKSSYHLYPILLEKCDRNKFIGKMHAAGIGVSVHFIPLHLMPFYGRAYGCARGSMPRAEDAYKKIASLPIYADLGFESASRVVREAEAIAGLSK